MEEAALAQLQITDEDMLASRSAVRALQIARLESMWEPVRVRLQQDEQGAPIDPRLLEIGLRIVKEEAMIYGLYRPAPPKQEDEDEQLGAGVDRAAEIARQLDAIEARRNQQG